MKKLMIDLGIEEFEITPGKFLRFNPADLNLYSRFLRVKDEILAVEKQLEADAEAAGKEINGESLLHLLNKADADMKVILNKAFGGENDFDDIFSGVNLMAVAGNGERVITNFVAAIAPIMEAGAKRAARDVAGQNAAQIRKNRQQRRPQA